MTNLGPATRVGPPMLRNDPYGVVNGNDWYSDARTCAPFPSCSKSTEVSRNAQSYR